MRAEEDYTVSDDTEITMGIGKILMLFFGLVILCGIALGVGYTLGRNSMKQAMANAGVATPIPVAVPVTASAAKPGAAQATPAAPPKADDAAPQNEAPAQSSTSDLTFSRSLSQKDDHPKLTPKAAPAPAPAAPAAHATLGAGYMVQVAAVRNQDDAKLLSESLQRQHFPVVIAQPGDKLYHVQVGPYAEVKDAEAIRGKLIAAGYNAFLKR